MSEPRAGAPDVTIVIVSWNTRELLDRCLEAAHASGPALRREIVVVDNASSDGSADRVASGWPGVRLIRNAANRGYAPACNQGLREARGRHVLALNTDAFLVGDALATLVRHMDAHPDVAACVPRLLNADGSTQRVCARRTPGLVRSLFAHTVLPAYVPRLHRWVQGVHPDEWYARTQDADVLSGACLLFRREALDRFGLLDDRLVLSYDDVEWCMRARRTGARLAYVPAAEAVHLGGQSRLLDVESNSVTSVASAATFWDLAFPRPAAAVLKATLLLSLCVSLAKNAVLAPFVASRRLRVAHLSDLCGRTARLVLRPTAGRAERAPW